MRKIGHYEDAVKVFGAHVDIASAASDFRLHELYCGDARTPQATEPVHYKVACVPQAWAAGSILHMLRACVNLLPEGDVLKVVNPRLPEWCHRTRYLAVFLPGLIAVLSVTRSEEERRSPFLFSDFCSFSRSI
jgi:glycogen debranching enzyme